MLLSHGCFCPSLPLPFLSLKSCFSQASEAGWGKAALHPQAHGQQLVCKPGQLCFHPFSLAWPLICKDLVVAAKRDLPSIGHLCRSRWPYDLKRAEGLNQETTDPWEILTLKQDRVLETKERTWTLEVDGEWLFKAQFCHLGAGVSGRT